MASEDDRRTDDPPGDSPHVAVSDRSATSTDAPPPETDDGDGNKRNWLIPSLLGLLLLLSGATLFAVLTDEDGGGLTQAQLQSTLERHDSEVGAGAEAMRREAGNAIVDSLRPGDEESGIEPGALRNEFDHLDGQHRSIGELLAACVDCNADTKPPESDNKPPESDAKPPATDCCQPKQKQPKPKPAEQKQTTHRDCCEPGPKPGKKQVASSTPDDPDETCKLLATFDANGTLRQATNEGCADKGIVIMKDIGNRQETPPPPPAQPQQSTAASYPMRQGRDCALDPTGCSPWQPSHDLIIAGHHGKRW